MRVPAFCDTCGAVFPSGIVAEDSASAIPAGADAGPCPVCTGGGHVPDRVFGFVASAIEILSVPQHSSDDLTCLAEILTEACRTKQSPEGILESIEALVPQLSGVSELLPGTRTELYSFVALTVAVVALLLQARRAGGDVSDLTVDRVIEHIFNETNVVAKSLGPSLRPRVRRNEPCTCGSGKRYKQCCGRLV